MKRLVTITRQWAGYMGTTTDLIWVRVEVSNEDIIERLKVSDMRLYGEHAQSYVIS